MYNSYDTDVDTSWLFFSQYVCVLTNVKKLQFIQMLTATYSELHIENSKNQKRLYYPATHRQMSMYCIKCTDLLIESLTQN